MNDLQVIDEERSIQEVTTQVAKIQTLMSAVMKQDEHYGVIPGTGKKPSLLKPGAEKLCFVFRLVPSFEIDREDFPNGHREYRIKCVLKTMGSGAIVGEGVGSCSTMESKYRYRSGPVEFTGRPVPKDYWDMRDSNPEEALKAIGGKGHSVKKNPDTSRWEIVIAGEKTENPDIADVYNTVLKMAKKRAHVDATITACAASDIFTQDIEDFQEEAPKISPKPAESPKAESKPASSARAPEGKKDAIDVTPAAQAASEATQGEDLFPGIDEAFDGITPEIEADMTARGRVRYIRLKHSASLSNDAKTKIDQALADGTADDDSFKKLYWLTQDFLFKKRGIEVPNIE